jgi:hypothetical protein
MKQILIILSIFFYTFNINAQDTILLKNGEIITASIIEKTNCKIEYQPTQITNRDTIIDLKLSKNKNIDYCSKSRDILIQQNPRSLFPLGMNVGMESLLFRLYLFNGSIDYLITPNISIEINYSTMFDYPYLSLYSVGGKYWFANKYSKSGFSTFTGLFYTQSRIKNDEDDIALLHEPVWSVDNYLEVPIGINYITKFGFHASLQMDFLLSYDSNKFNIGGGLIDFRLGWRFKTSKKGY